ncbi:gp53-like domain-containing protein [Paraburkholderia phenoliruptrix]|uniref:gp53-like domain-containing protein n=1 Tax=Paraburkholderia phenoliruptrix TaxID=252970 RepID=UPI0034CFB3E2
MAYQPEAVQYDSGIYQLEAVDPVDGGVGAVSNKPLLSLANRTAYLKQHVDNLESGATIPPTVAPLNSPNLTGTPIAPTPAPGDNSTKISTTAFVNNAVGGLNSINVAGGANVSLTAAQAGYGTLVFTGALTANIAVIVPNSAARWIVENLTTGAYTLTVKTAAGTGIAVTQGKTQEVFCDGTNVLLASNDFVNVTLTGTATAPTPSVGDSSTKVATTAFVYQLTNGVVSVNVAGSADVTLTPAQYGNGIILLTGALTGSINVFVPAQGGTYVIANKTSGAYSLNVAVTGTPGTKALVPQGQSVVAYSDGTNVVLAGAAATSSFTNYSFTATAGQTVFNAPYTPGNLLVLVNGVAQDPADITATNGSSVTLTAYNGGNGCFVSDNVRIIVFNSFTVANALTLAGGTMTGPILMAGGDTGVTPAQFDNSTKLATTAFVQRALGNFQSFSSISAATTLTASQSGSVFELGGSSAYTVTLPPPTTANLRFTLLNTSSVNLTIASASGSIYWMSTSAASSVTLNSTTAIELVSDGGNWIAFGGHGYASLAANGYQKLPSGFILQWCGPFTVPGNAGSLAITFPIAFPSALYSAQVSVAGAATNEVGWNGGTTTGLTLNTGNTDGTSRSAYVWAIGR